jgi:pilus assembly protein Flp/PilA
MFSRRQGRDESQAHLPATAQVWKEETHIMIKQFFVEEEGQTLVEYGLLISLIALVVIAVLTLLGGKIKNTFNTASASISTTTS